MYARTKTEAVRYFTGIGINRTRDIQNGLWRMFGIQASDATIYAIKWRLKNPPELAAFRQAKKLVATIGKSKASKHLSQLANNPVGGKASRFAQETLECVRSM